MNQVNGWIQWSKCKINRITTKKMKTAVKNNAVTTLRMSLKMFDGNDLLHELLLTTKQRTKLRNAFNSTMSTDIKLKFKFLE